MEAIHAHPSYSCFGLGEGEKGRGLWAGTNSVPKLSSSFLSRPISSGPSCLQNNLSSFFCSLSLSTPFLGRVPFYSFLILPCTQTLCLCYTPSQEHRTCTRGPNVLTAPAHCLLESDHGHGHRGQCLPDRQTKCLSLH